MKCWSFVTGQTREHGGYPESCCSYRKVKCDCLDTPTINKILRYGNYDLTKTKGRESKLLHCQKIAVVFFGPFCRGLGKPIALHLTRDATLLENVPMASSLDSNPRDTLVKCACSHPCCRHGLRVRRVYFNISKR